VCERKGEQEKVQKYILINYVLEENVAARSFDMVMNVHAFAGKTAFSSVSHHLSRSHISLKINQIKSIRVISENPPYYRSAIFWPTLMFQKSK
jgi:hypothetical protein